MPLTTRGAGAAVQVRVVRPWSRCSAGSAGSRRSVDPAEVESETSSWYGSRELRLGAAAPSEQPQVAAGAAVRSICNSAVRPADDVAIFLRDDISAQQRGDLDTALRSDPLVRDVRFENHDEAYAKFRVL